MGNATTWGWGWVDGEDEEEGNRWIQIGALEPSECGPVLGEEEAIIMCRNFDRVEAEHPEWIRQKEAMATRICDALNAQEKANG